MAGYTQLMRCLVLAKLIEHICAMSSWSSSSVAMLGLQNADAALHVQAKHAPLQHLNADTAASVIPWLAPYPDRGCPRVSFPAGWWYALSRETTEACLQAFAEIGYRMLAPSQEGHCSYVEFMGCKLLAELYRQSRAESSAAEQRVAGDHGVDAAVSLKSDASKSKMDSEPASDEAGLSIASQMLPEG